MCCAVQWWSLDVRLFQAYEQSNIQVPGRGWLFVFSMSIENKCWDKILIIAEWQVISYLAKNLKEKKFALLSAQACIEIHLHSKFKWVLKFSLVGSVLYQRGFASNLVWFNQVNGLCSYEAQQNFSKFLQSPDILLVLRN